MRSSRSSGPVLRLGLLLALTGLTSCGRAAVAFDGQRAFRWIERQCAFGPRVPGSAAHDSCFSFLVGRLRALAPVVETDTFHYESPVLAKRVQLMNALARFRPEADARVILAAHWDSRPWADRDPDPRLRDRPVLGANDGASGVAVLLELARHFGVEAPGVGVDLVLFDGEDLGTDGDPSGYLRGSRRYVEWKALEAPPLFVIVLDMVGGRDLLIHEEGHSKRFASNIVDLVWAEARERGSRRFIPEVKHTVFDDHIPFLEEGIPAVVLIDLDFPEWHTTRDTPAICDPASLEAVGAVLLSLVTKADFLAR